MDSEAVLKRIRWGCRRGMLELDLCLLPFFDHEFAKLSEEDKSSFVSLLEEADSDLQLWLTNQAKPDSPKLQRIVDKIRVFNHSHHPC